MLQVNPPDVFTPLRKAHAVVFVNTQGHGIQAFIDFLQLLQKHFLHVEELIYLLMENQVVPLVEIRNKPLHPVDQFGWLFA
jgi:hypothetical protein